MFKSIAVTIIRIIAVHNIIPPCTVIITNVLKKSSAIYSMEIDKKTICGTDLVMHLEIFTSEIKVFCDFFVTIKPLDRLSSIEEGLAISYSSPGPGPSAGAISMRSIPAAKQQADDISITVYVLLHQLSI